MAAPQISPPAYRSPPIGRPPASFPPGAGNNIVPFKRLPPPGGGGNSRPPSATPVNATPAPLPPSGSLPPLIPPPRISAQDYASMGGFVTGRFSNPFSNREFDFALPDFSDFVEPVLSQIRGLVLRFFPPPKIEPPQVLEFDPNLAPLFTTGNFALRVNSIADASERSNVFFSPPYITKLRSFDSGLSGCDRFYIEHNRLHYRDSSGNTTVNDPVLLEALRASGTVSPPDIDVFVTNISAVKIAPELNNAGSPAPTAPSPTRPPDLPTVVPNTPPPPAEQPFPPDVPQRPNIVPFPRKPATPATPTPQPQREPEPKPAEEPPEPAQPPEPEIPPSDPEPPEPAPEPPTPAPAPNPTPAPDKAPPPQESPPVEPKPRVPTPAPTPLPDPIPKHDIPLVPAPIPAPTPTPVPAPTPRPAPTPDTPTTPVPSTPPNPAEPTPDPEPKVVPAPAPLDPCKSKDPCLANISDTVKNTDLVTKAAAAEGAAILAILTPVPTPVKVFVKCDKGKPEFGTELVAIPGNSIAYVSKIFDRLAELEGQKCTKPDGSDDLIGIATVPEWWQIPLENYRPQLIVIYRVLNDDGTWAGTQYAITIPNPNEDYKKRPAAKPSFPEYKKGNYQGILRLNDNTN